MKEVTIIDYGLSNILSVKRAFEVNNVVVKIENTSEGIINAKALVLPGVGAFRDGMNKLKELNLIDAIKEKASLGTPLLGICLGMQMLFEESDEFGICEGLGLLKGRIEAIPQYDVEGSKQRIPHIGWNGLWFDDEQKNYRNSILNGIEQGDETYFIHSFEAKPLEENCIADTILGGRHICAMVQKNNIFGCQFHPEKSGKIGLKIIENYISISE